MKLAEDVSTRSTCLRRQVGAVLVREKRILTTGYNGAPRGINHCSDAGCIREKLGVPSGERHELCRGLHAEMNAVIQAAVHGISVKDSTLFCTNMPCSYCTKTLINVGVKEMVVAEDYHDDLTVVLLKEAGVPVELYTKPGRWRVT